LTVLDNFKGTHYPKSVILYAGFFYVRYGVSYRDLEEIMEELGFKAFHSAAATLAGIETAHMIRKGQLDINGPNTFQQFAALAA
jgi:transposase-like protein